jgi:ABC-type branched-subunit amino acid transport system substrate-binding protein
MRIAIVGSCDYRDLETVRRYIAALPDDAIVVSGAKGRVDEVAEEAAQARGLDTLIFPPDWDRKDNVSEQQWNRMIVKNADLVVAFWDGRSPGTAQVIEAARELGKRLEVFVSG